MIDEGRPTVFAQALIMTEIGLSDFLDWAQTIVAPLGGDVWDAGHAHAGIDRADHVEIGQMIVNDNGRLRALT